MEGVFPNNNHTNRLLWREYLPHALELIYEDEFTKRQDNYIDLVQKIADCLYSDGIYTEAEVLYKALLKIDQERNGAEHPSTLTSMANLASTYRNQGRWNEAEKLEVQVMKTRKTVLGVEHPDTLTSMHNLALTWESQGKLQGALTLMKKCSELRSKILGPNHPDARSSSRTLSNWLDNYNSLPDQTPLIQKECLHHLQEISASPAAAVAIAQSIHKAHLNLPDTQRRSTAQLFLGNHPLIIASRTPSPTPGGQHLEEVD